MERLSSLAFNAYVTPDDDDSISVFQAKCIEGDEETIKLVLKLCPNIVDLIMALRTKVQGETLEDHLKLFETSAHQSILNMFEKYTNDVKGISLIHLAACCGNALHISELCQYCGIFKEGYMHREHTSVLNHAAQHNSLDVVKEILCHRTSLQDQDYERYYPIHFAARNGRTDIVEYMLEQDIKLRDVLGRGFTPLHMAAVSGNTGTVELLLRAGADVNVGIRRNRCCIRKVGKCMTVLRRPCNCESPMKVLNSFEYSETEETTSIMLAAAMGHLYMFELLTKHNAIIDNKSNILFHAAKGGNFVIVKKLLDLGLNVMTCDEDENSLLHVASTPDIIELLIKLGLDVNARNGNDETPLHMAAYNNNIKAVEMLVQHGADVGAVSHDKYESFYSHRYSCTPLLYAIKYAASPKIITFLLTKTAAVSQLYFSEERSIWWFARIYQPDIIKSLLRFNLNVNIVMEWGCTPLHMLVSNSDPETVKCLIEHGADVKAVDVHGEIPLHYAVKASRPKNIELLLALDESAIMSVSKYGYNALFCASDIKCAQLLLDEGIDIMQVDNCGRTVFICFAGWNREICLDFLLQYACNRGINVTEATAPNGWTALHFSAFHNSVSVSRILLKHNFNIDVIDKAGRSPLIVAVQFGSCAVVKLLLNEGTTLNTADIKNNTLLFYSIINPRDNTKILKVLVEQDAAIMEARDSGGRTLLHISALLGDRDSTRILLEKCSDVNSVDNALKTPLHLNLENHSNLVLMLLKSGANANAADKTGNTPLHNALNYNCQKWVVDLLKEHGAHPNLRNKNGQTPNDLLSI